MYKYQVILLSVVTAFKAIDQSRKRFTRIGRIEKNSLSVCK